MNEYLIKKVIAYDGEREVVQSDQEEMHRFIVEGIRPCFNDTTVLAVKFLYCVCEDDDEPEESVWYVNPYYCENEHFRCSSAYGPRMDSSFIPELLLIHKEKVDIFKKYEAFHTTLLIEGLNGMTDHERLELFLRKLKDID